jgi:hypothetical protein
VDLSILLSVDRSLVHDLLQKAISLVILIQSEIWQVIFSHELIHNIRRNLLTISGDVYFINKLDLRVEKRLRLQNERIALFKQLSLETLNLIIHLSIKRLKVVESISLQAMVAGARGLEFLQQRARDIAIELQMDLRFFVLSEQFNHLCIIEMLPGDRHHEIFLMDGIVSFLEVTLL